MLAGVKNAENMNAAIHELWLDKHKPHGHDQRQFQY